MGVASDSEFIGNSCTSGLIAMGTAWYLSDVPPDAATAIWPNVVMVLVLLFNFPVWIFPATYSDPDRHPVLYGCFSGIPFLLAFYGLHGTAYATQSLIYLGAGSITLTLGLSISLFHSVRQRFFR